MLKYIVNCCFFSEKVIIFLTGSNPGDSSSPSTGPGSQYPYGGDILKNIRDLNAAMDNSVIILTYGIGNGEKLLTRLKEVID